MEKDLALKIHPGRLSKPTACGGEDTLSCLVHPGARARRGRRHDNQPNVTESVPPVGSRLEIVESILTSRLWFTNDTTLG
jgi:hypothetical protein